MSPFANLQSWVRPLLCVGLVALAAACASEQGRGYGYGGYGYPSYGGGYYGPAGVGGSGARNLDPWLANTNTGQQLVLRRFDKNYNGEIGTGRARQANEWFRRFADRDRDMRLTDNEIDNALAELSRNFRRSRY